MEVWNVRPPWEARVSHWREGSVDESRLSAARAMRNEAAGSTPVPHSGRWKGRLIICSFHQKRTSWLQVTEVRHVNSGTRYSTGLWSEPRTPFGKVEPLAAIEYLPCSVYGSPVLCECQWVVACCQTWVAGCQLVSLRSAGSTRDLRLLGDGRLSGGEATPRFSARDDRHVKSRWRLALLAHWLWSMIGGDPALLGQV